jgi:hypothetical protein
MHRKSAAANMRLGITLTLIAILMMAVAFGWAALYLGTSHG